MRWLTTFAGWLANCKISWVKNRLIQYFVWRYPVNLEEALITDPYQYSSFNDFFTRELRPNARVIASGLHDLVSPADGKISQLGNIVEGEIIQAKGHYYSVDSLLGKDQNEIQPFMNGSFLTVYLAPKDYHRVHMPIDGKLSEMRYIPGTLFSVGPKTTERTPELFAKNERVVTFYNTSIGRVAVVLVGAMIVGNIETVWAGTITPPRGQARSVTHTEIKSYQYHAIHLNRGEELGRFKLGSTVIVLFEQNKITWDPGVREEQAILMGQRLGSFKPDQW